MEEVVLMMMSSKDSKKESTVKNRESVTSSLNDLQPNAVQNLRASDNNSSNDELLLQKQISSDSNVETQILIKDGRNSVSVSSLADLNDENTVGLKKEVHNHPTNLSHVDTTSTKSVCSVSKCACILGCFYLINQFVDSYGSVGSFLFQISGVILYVVDVVTDIVSGVDLLSGTEINHTMFDKGDNENYTRVVCNHLLDHSHPIWGSINIGFAWFPVLMAVPTLFYQWYCNWQLSMVANSTTNSEIYQIHWTMKALTVLIVVLFWPLIGLILYVCFRIRCFKQFNFS